MSDWSVEKAIEHYGVENWSGGYFSINEKGNLAVIPDPNDQSVTFDLRDVVDEILSEGIELPVVVRFHDVLRSRVKLINQYFNDAIAFNSYQGKYCGVFPIKVNQMREVVEEIVDAGQPFNFGLEAGSKAELLAVLALNENPEALTICNGYKDEEFMRLAMIGRSLERKIIVVIEKPSEIESILAIADETGIKPIIGLRAKLFVKGKGQWEDSSGDKAKFGLTLPEIVNALGTIEARGYSDCVKLLHFHIGSQLADINCIQDAVTEAARLYTSLVKMGVPLEYLDVGGGLAVDYDGSQSSNVSSMNYGLREYVANIVDDVKQICDLENVAHPHLISESGRAISAHHSCVITNVVGEISNTATKVDLTADDNEHYLLKNMRRYEAQLSQGKQLEVYHDVLKTREESLSAFKLGVLPLIDLAKVESIYFQVLNKINEIHKEMDETPSDLEHLQTELAAQYICNFSLFQSAADSWAIKQVLPIMPISRLDEKPEKQCTLVDITCDSDGKIKQFVGEDGVVETLSVHSLDQNQPYYLGLFLTGAYQDVMGDMHNLFSRLTEVHVYCDDDDPSDFYLEEVVDGATISHALETMQYNPSYLAQTVKKQIDAQVAKGNLRPRQGVKHTDFYEKLLQGYTYNKS